VAVAVLRSKYAWTRYRFEAVGVKVRPATAALAVALVGKSTPSMTFVQGSEPPPGVVHSVA
jgi:hypothetical protein